MLADVGVERFLAAVIEGVQQPGHPSGDRHPPQLAQPGASALIQRGEHGGRRIPVEVSCRGIIGQRGSLAEVVPQQVPHRQAVDAGHPGQPGRQRLVRPGARVQRPAPGRAHASSRSNSRRRSVGPA